MQTVKILKVNLYVPNLVKYHVKTYGDFNVTETYTSQVNNFYNKFYWPGTGLESSLEKLNYETTSLFFDISNSCSLSNLNLAWSKEFYSDIEEDKIYRALIKQIIFYQPEIIIIQDGYIFEKGFYDSLKNNIPKLKAIFILCGTIVSPKKLENTKEVTAALCIADSFAEQFNTIGVPTYILEHAFDERVLDYLKPISSKINRLIFSGTVEMNYLGINYHEFRKDVLDEFIIQEMPLDIYTPQQHIFKNFKNLYEPLFGLNMLQKNSNYLINLNIHPNVAKGKTSNVRLFELTGIGSCLLTDKTDNINEFLKEDYEVVTFLTKEEAIDKAKFLLKNPSIALDIGRRAQEKILSKHTYKNKASQLSQILKQYI